MLGICLERPAQVCLSNVERGRDANLVLRSRGHCNVNSHFQQKATTGAPPPEHLSQLADLEDMGNPHDMSDCGFDTSVGAFCFPVLDGALAAEDCKFINVSCHANFRPTTRVIACFE